MKNLKKKDQKLSFQIKGIELLDVKLNHQNQPLPVQMTYNFNISLEYKIIQANKLVLVIPTIDIFHEDKITLLASLKSSCVFEIANFEDFIVEGSSQVSLSDGILETLNSISISTTRGIMFSQFKGTFLHNAFLPIIDPKSFVKNKPD